MGLVSKVTIEIDGETIRNFMEFKIQQRICDHHEFEVKCRTETFEEPNTFLIEKSKRFIGKEIKIEIESFSSGFSGSRPALYFKGLITDVKASKSGFAEDDHILISGYSPDILLQDNPGCNSFPDFTLKQVVDKVLTPYPRDMIRYQVRPSNIEKHPYTVQYNESRYNFLKRLAVRFGEWFFYDGTELVFGAPTGRSSNLCLGEDMQDFSFSIRINPLNMKYVTYNPSTARSVESATNSSTGSNSLNEYGNFAHQKSMRLFNQNSVRLYNHLATDESVYGTEVGNVTDLQGGAIALGMSAAIGKSHNPELILGGKTTIKAVKTHASGKIDLGEYFITSITHYCDSLLNYSNEFACIPSKAKLPDYTDPMAFPHCETQSAKVINNDDPEKLGRVKVRFFWQPSGAESPWIRIANQHAGSESGFYFVPELDQEVMVGFESGDAEKPYVLGSLFNGNNKPDGSWGSGGNDIKAIRTRSGNTIELIDSQGQEQIIIYQENDKSASHHISLTAGSDPTLSIFSKGKLVIEASSIQIKSTAGSIEVESSDSFKVQSASELKMVSLNVNINADAEMKMEATSMSSKGNSMNTISSGSMTVLTSDGATNIHGESAIVIQATVVAIN